MLLASSSKKLSTEILSWLVKSVVQERRLQICLWQERIMSSRFPSPAARLISSWAFSQWLTPSQELVSIKNQITPSVYLSFCFRIGQHPRTQLFVIVFKRAERAMVYSIWLPRRRHLRRSNWRGWHRSSNGPIEILPHRYSHPKRFIRKQEGRNSD